MTKFQLKVFFKVSYELILVFLQFFIISLHFFQWELLPKKQIVQVSPLSYLTGFLIILLSLATCIKIPLVFKLFLATDFRGILLNCFEISI